MSNGVKLFCYFLWTFDKNGAAFKSFVFLWLRWKLRKSQFHKIHRAKTAVALAKTSGKLLRKCFLNTKSWNWILNIAQVTRQQCLRVITEVWCFDSCQRHQWPCPWNSHGTPNVFLSDGQAEENMERCRLRHEDYRLESRVMQGVPKVYRLFGQGHTRHHNYFHKIDVLLIPLSLPLSNIITPVESLAKDSVEYLQSLQEVYAELEAGKIGNIGSRRSLGTMVALLMPKAWQRLDRFG